MIFKIRRTISSKYNIQRINNILVILLRRFKLLIRIYGSHKCKESCKYKNSIKLLCTGEDRKKFQLKRVSYKMQASIHMFESSVLFSLVILLTCSLDGIREPWGYQLPLESSLCNWKGEKWVQNSQRKTDVGK